MPKKIHIKEVARSVNINEERLVYYGDHIAKIKKLTVNENKQGKLILVSAMTPTATGEGKTTMAIALHDGLWAINEKSLLCLREPSLGPVFGRKGGATGGGRARLFPSDDINLHFTGDLHALTSSINLIAAIIDNHIFQGNELQIDINNIVWKRALDMNDRALRDVKVALGEGNGTPRIDHFQITVASELMAILCLSENDEDFKERVRNIIVAYDTQNKPIFLKSLQIEEAIFHLMKKALMPNLVQTYEGNPVFVHGGPFANIAHGCSSLIATKTALNLAPIVITEAGFASDLGAEKFMNIKCRIGDIAPDLALLVVTLKAIKEHGGVSAEELNKMNTDAITVGFANVMRHYENLNNAGLPVIVLINEFPDDYVEEKVVIEKLCKQNKFEYSFVTSYSDGSKGALDLARKVKTMLTVGSNFKFLYDVNDEITHKIQTIARKVYRAKDVIFTSKAQDQIKAITDQGFSNLPICMAKTPVSFTDDPSIKNAPDNFTITVREVTLNAGAKFIVALTGKILTMPGLPPQPAALNMKEVK